MPKDEIDPEDPLELRAVALITTEDTTEAMTDCFMEEFLRLGYSASQILALFRNPHYTGAHGVWATRGEDFVKQRLLDACQVWRRPVDFHSTPRSARTSAGSDERSPLPEGPACAGCEPACSSVSEPHPDAAGGQPRSSDSNLSHD